MLERDLDLFELFEDPVLFCDEVLPESDSGSQNELMDDSRDLNESARMTEPNVLDELNDSNESDLIDVDKIIAMFTEDVE